MLILSELQLFHQAIAYLLDRGLHTTRRATARRAAARLAAARRRVGRCRLDARRPEPERGVRNLQDARLLRGHELDVRRHSRDELSRRIRHRDDHRVGDDVLDDLSRLPDLRDSPDERFPGKRVDREAGAVVELDAADVRLVHARLDLHPREVLGDGEEHRSLKARGDGLADVHLAGDDDAVHGGLDRRVVEIDLGLLERGILLLHQRTRGLGGGLGHAELGERRLDTRRERLLSRPGGVELGHRSVVGGLRRVEIALGDELATEQLRLPVEVTLGVHGLHQGLGGERLGFHEPRAGVVDVGPGALDLRVLVQDVRPGGVQIRLRLVDPGLEDVRVDPGDDLVLLDDRVEVDHEVLDHPGDLAPDLDDDHGVQVAGRRDRSGEGTSLDTRHPVLWGIAAALGVEVGEDAPTHQDRHDDHRHDASHHSFRRRHLAGCFSGLSDGRRHDPAVPGRSDSPPGPGSRCSGPG